MIIDSSALEKALAQLQKSMRYLNSEPSQNDPDLREQFRAAVIQAYEYTYELAFKLILRQLEQISPNPTEIRGMAFKDVMRTAADAGIIRDPRLWTLYREKRNITSHAYEEEKAEEVLQDLEVFVQDIRFVLAEVNRRNRGD